MFCIVVTNNIPEINHIVSQLMFQLSWQNLLSSISMLVDCSPQLTQRLMGFKPITTTEVVHLLLLCCFEHNKTPAKIVLPFLCTAPLQCAPKILFTQTTIDCLIIGKTKNALHKERVILNNVLAVTQLSIA